MKTTGNKKKKPRINNIEQFYVIKIESSIKNIEYLDYAFKNYSEARRCAQNIIRKRNNLNVVRREVWKENDGPVLFKEITPDYWVNNHETLIIKVITIKDFNIKRSAMAEKMMKKSIVADYIEEEILM